MEKVYNKEELKNKFGNPVVLSQELNLAFGSGIPLIENMPQERGRNKITLKKHEKGIVIKQHSIGINDDNISKIIFHFQQRKFITKEKSVLWRAVISGIIGGILGILIGITNPLLGLGVFLIITIIGALTGIGESKEELPVNGYSKIEIISKVLRDKVIMYCNFNRQNNVLDWLKEFYPDKFIIPKGENEGSEDNFQVKKKDKIGEITKLAELKSNGMISDEEYEKLKKEILG